MDAKAQAQHEARITRALMKLGSARREKLDKLDFETYVEGLSEFRSETVEQVCGDYARIAPDDYQPRFPPLHLLREACHRIVERLNEQRQLQAAPLEDRYPPLSEAKWAEIRQQFDRVLRRRTMPGAKAAAAGDRE